MGTRADFYIGRGEHAEWIGSIAWDGHPESIDKQILNCQSPEAFRHAVNEFIGKRDDGSQPADGWPWPWEDSRTTDYSYAMDGDRVHASCFGRGWFDPNNPPEDYCDGEKVAVFPNMKGAKRRPLFGPHSGVIVVGR